MKLLVEIWFQKIPEVHHFKHFPKKVYYSTHAFFVSSFVGFVFILIEAFPPFFFSFLVHHAVQMHFKQFLLISELWFWCVQRARLLWTRHMLKGWILTFVFSKWLFNWKIKYLMSYFHPEGRERKKILWFIPKKNSCWCLVRRQRWAGSN